MATDKDRTILGPPDQFERLARAVEAIAARSTITTTVEPRPLDESAKKAAEAYGVIAGSLRTIFESFVAIAPAPAPSPTTPTMIRNATE